MKALGFLVSLLSINYTFGSLRGLKKETKLTVPTGYNDDVDIPTNRDSIPTEPRRRLTTFAEQVFSRGDFKILFGRDEHTIEAEAPWVPSKSYAVSMKETQYKELTIQGDITLSYEIDKDWKMDEKMMLFFTLEKSDVDYRRIELRLKYKKEGQNRQQIMCLLGSDCGQIYGGGVSGNKRVYKEEMKKISPDLIDSYLTGLAIKVEQKENASEVRKKHEGLQYIDSLVKEDKFQVHNGENKVGHNRFQVHKGEYKVSLIEPDVSGMDEYGPFYACGFAKGVKSTSEIDVVLILCSSKDWMQQSRTELNIDDNKEMCTNGQYIYRLSNISLLHEKKVFGFRFSCIQPDFKNYYGKNYFIFTHYVLYNSLVRFENDLQFSKNVGEEYSMNIGKPYQLIFNMDFAVDVDFQFEKCKFNADADYVLKVLNGGKEVHQIDNLNFDCLFREHDNIKYVQVQLNKNSMYYKYKASGHISSNGKMSYVHAKGKFRLPNTFQVEVKGLKSDVTIVFPRVASFYRDSSLKAFYSHNEHSIMLYTDVGESVGYSDALVRSMEITQSGSKIDLGVRFEWVPCGILSNSKCTDNNSEVKISELKFATVSRLVVSGDREAMLINNVMEQLKPGLHHVSTEAKIQMETRSFVESEIFSDSPFKISESKKDLRLINLLPGKLYDLILKTSDNAGKALPQDDGGQTMLATGVVPCYCNTDGVDTTGKPINLKIVQSKGFVYLTFTDNSLCEEAFAIERSEYNGNDNNDVYVIAANYYFYMDNQCGDILSPNKDYSDDLNRHDLAVGTWYKYCVSAIAPQYMAQVASEANSYLPFERASKPACINHSIQWESSAIVSVQSLKSSGSLPIKGVKISWVLHSKEGIEIQDSKGEAITGDDGKINIDFKLDGIDMDTSAQEKNKYGHALIKCKARSTLIDGSEYSYTFLCDDPTECPDDAATTTIYYEIRGSEGEAVNEADDKMNIGFELDGIDMESTVEDKNNHEYKLSLSAAKSTLIDGTEYPHTFLCDDSTECPDGVATTTIYLKHLQFENDVLFIDDTQSPITGTIRVKDTDEKCSIEAATVCLKQKHGRVFVGTNICTETNINGVFSLPVTLGSTVSLDISYMNHTFQASSIHHEKEMKHGVKIVEGKQYINYDFYDSSKSSIIIGVAGGICNKTLGKSTVQMTINGCSEWKKILYQKQYKQIHLVPAHLLDFKVVDVHRNEEELIFIKEYFADSRESNNIDLREIRDEKGTHILFDRNIYTPDNDDRNGLTLPVDYVISFEIKPMNVSSDQNGLLNLFRLTSILDNNGVDKLPAMFMSADSHSLHVSFTTPTGEKNFASNEILATEKLNSVQLIVYDDFVTLKINEVLAGRVHMPASERSSMKDVTLISSTLENIADVEISNFALSAIDTSKMKPEFRAFFPDAPAIVVKKNNYVGTVHKLPKEYVLSFTVDLSKTDCRGWCSLLRITNTNTNLRQFGDRSPLLGIKPNKSKVVLFFEYCSTRRYYYLDTEDLSLGGKHKVQIMIWYSTILLTIDGNSLPKFHSPISDRLEMNDAKIFVGDPFFKEPSQTTIEDLVLHPLRPDYPTIELVTPKHDPPSIRFQFNGTLVMDEPKISGDRLSNTTCLRKGLPEDCNKNGKTCSNNVVQTTQQFNASISLKHELVPGEVYCDIVDESTTVTIQNNVGLNPNIIEDVALITKRNESGKFTDDHIALMSKCTAEACSVNVKHNIDETTHLKSGAKVDEMFIAGFPTVQGNHKKTLSIQLDSNNMHDFNIVVTGDKQIQGGKSFGFPTHHPLLVLRDPPGGNSYVSYSNVVTTVAIQHTSMESYIGIEGSVSISGGVDVGESACVGFGAYYCTDVAVGGASFGGTMGGGSNFLVGYNEETSSHQFTSAWSYTTSDDPELAGSNSDVVLVPNINVEFHQVTRVAWKDEDCEASASDRFVYDLKSDDNKAAFSFLTFQQVESKVKPELKAILDDLEQSVTLISKKTKINKNDEETMTKYNFIQEAKMRWETFIEEYNLNSKEVKGNKGEFSKVNDWFDLPEGGNLALRKHWKGLVPEKFDEEKNENFKNSGYTVPPNVPNDAFESINRIQFSGGGGSLSFSLDQIAVDNLVTLQGLADGGWLGFLGDAVEKGITDPSSALDTIPEAGEMFLNNKDWSSHIGATAETDLTIAKVALLIEGEITGTISGSERAFEGVDLERETSIELLLGDPDSSDEFALDIYLDPTHNTFMFDVRSGISSCPWEGEPTSRLHDPRMEMLTPLPPVVPANHPMIFRVKMWNNRNTVLDDYSIPVYAEVVGTSNLNDLKIQAFGTNLVSPMNLWLSGSQEIIAEIAVMRGPTDYRYDPIVLALKAQCEGDMTTPAFEMSLANNNGNIEYLRSCPTVRWAGDLLLDQTFYINKDSNNNMEVIINNLGSSRLHNETIDGNILEDVVLQYRKHGSLLWNEARTESNKVINFAEDGLEDSYGYIVVNWSVQNIKKDGRYEIRVLCRCSGGKNVPTEFKQSSTEVIMGYIDKRSPRIYGKSSVEKNKYNYPDQEVMFEFTEDIDCRKPYQFEFRISSVQDKKMLIKNENLDIKCEGSVLRFYFDPIVRNNLFGKYMRISIDDVTDVAGNPMSHQVQFKFESQEQRRLIEKGLDQVEIDQEFDAEDHQPHAISIGFDPIDEFLFYDSERKMLFVKESKKSFMNVMFWHKVEGNLNKKVKVDVKLMSNEKSLVKPMAAIVKRVDVDQGRKLEVYIEPSSCKTKEETTGDFCVWNPDISIRFYQINVDASDTFGNVASTKGTIFVLPSDYGVKEFGKEKNFDVEYFESIIAKESKLLLETETTDWDIM